MKLIGETRFDVSEEDAEEHKLEAEQCYGLALVFACTPKERSELKDFVDKMAGNEVTHLLIPVADIEEQKRQLEQARANAGPSRSLFEIPGVYVLSYDMNQRAPRSSYRGIGGFDGERATSFQEMGIRMRIEVETNDGAAAEELMQLLKRSQR
jgi:hypothetical protein